MQMKSQIPVLRAVWAHGLPLHHYVVPHQLVHQPNPSCVWMGLVANISPIAQQITNVHQTYHLNVHLANVN